MMEERNHKALIEVHDRDGVTAALKDLNGENFKTASLKNGFH